MELDIVVLFTLAFGLLTALYFLNRKKEKDVGNDEKPATGRAAVRHGQRNARNEGDNPARNRLRNRIQVRNVEPQNDMVEDDDDNLRNNEDEINNDVVQDREELRKKIGTKKLAKLEEKAERRKQNEAMLQEREERKEKEELAYENRKKKEMEEERLEKEKEELDRLAKEAQEKKEHEEYLILKEQFLVEEEGQEAVLTETESQNLLMEFVSYIKKSKVVVLEDLAAEFNLKTQDVINRVNLVQEMGLLTGVMDDRGKFIYISEEELLQVKKFIEQRGRVNISELAKSSNQLICMKPSADKVEAAQA